MSIATYGQFCWNSTMLSPVKYKIYIGTTYLTVCSLEFNGSSNFYIVSTSGFLSINIQLRDGIIASLQSLDGVFVTDKRLFLIVAGSVYSSSLSKLVDCLRKKVSSIVVKEIILVLPSESSDKNQSIISIGSSSCGTFVLSCHGIMSKVLPGEESSTLVPMNPFSISSVQQVACGNDHCVLLRNNGSVFTMGIGSRGQLGHGDLVDVDRPTQVESLETLFIVRVAAGGWHSAFLSSHGDLYLCGWNESDQLGVCELSMWSDPQPLDLPPVVCDNEVLDETICGVSCGMHHTVLWTERNSVFCLGGSLMQSTSTNKILLDSQFCEVSCGHKSSSFCAQEPIECRSFDFGFVVFSK